MPSDDKKFKARISALEQDIESLKNVLGAYAVGIDKVSQVQANLTNALSNLVLANETQAQFLSKVLAVTEKKESVVFISYSHADKELVDILSKRFDEDTISYWRDEKDVLIGQVIDKAISEGIQNSWLFLIILSPASIKSKWVEREFDEASYEEIEGKKIILPVIANGLKAEKLPARIRRRLYVDLSNDLEKGYQKLKKSILAYKQESRKGTNKKLAKSLLKK